MDKCQHGTKISLFCISDHCSSKQSNGCQLCIKKYHNHVGTTNIIRSQQINQLINKFCIQNSIKPKCRTFQQHIINFFSTIKSQFSSTLDNLCKNIVNHIGYPYLSNLQYLSTFKKLKNKDYRKISSKQLKTFYQQCFIMKNQDISQKQKHFYKKQVKINLQILKQCQNIMKNYEDVVKKYIKGFKHDNAGYKKIEQLKLTVFDKMGLAEDQKIEDQKYIQQGSNNKEFLQIISKERIKLNKPIVMQSPKQKQPKKLNKSLSILHSFDNLQQRFKIQQSSLIKQFPQSSVIKQFPQLSVIKQFPQSSVIKQKQLPQLSLIQPQTPTQLLNRLQQPIKNQFFFKQPIKQQKQPSPSLINSPHNTPHRQKYKNIRNQSLDTQNKSITKQLLQFGNNLNYQSNEKQISLRKEKLIEMLSFKEKNKGKSQITQKNQKNQKNQKDNTHVNFNINNSVNRDQRNSIGIGKYQQRKGQSKGINIKSSSIAKHLKKSDSISNFITNNNTNSNIKLLNQPQAQQPYKYGMRRVPSYSNTLQLNSINLQSHHMNSLNKNKNDKYLLQQNSNIKNKRQLQQENNKISQQQQQHNNNNQQQQLYHSRFLPHSHSHQNYHSNQNQHPSPLPTCSQKQHFLQQSQTLQKKLSSSYNSNQYQINASQPSSQQSSSILLIKSLQSQLSISQSIEYLKASLKYSRTNLSAAEYLSYLYLENNQEKECLMLCKDVLFMLNNVKIEKEKSNKQQYQQQFNNQLFNNQLQLLKLPFITNTSASLNLLGRYSQSITLIQSFLSTFPLSSCPILYKNLADAYLSIGILSKCQYNYQKSIQLNPKYDQAMYNLAVCLYNQGNYNNSYHYVLKAKKINIINQEYNKLKEQLEKILVVIDNQ